MCPSEKGTFPLCGQLLDHLLDVCPSGDIHPCLLKMSSGDGHSLFGLLSHFWVSAGFLRGQFRHSFCSILLWSRSRRTIIRGVRRLFRLKAIPGHQPHLKWNRIPGHPFPPEIPPAALDRKRQGLVSIIFRIFLPLNDLRRCTGISCILHGGCHRNI